MAPVTLNKVGKNFAGVKVLSGIDLNIDEGEFVVLVGPSGCGKSTLLRCIAGLEDVSSGEICIGDRVVNDMAPRDRDIAMVFQSYALYPHMDVTKNMSFSLAIRKAPIEKIRSLVAAASAKLGLDPLLQRLPKQLSGGQRQRVAMGRAIVRQPQVFLFDEPLSNLDAKLRAQMRTEIKALHLSLKTTSVYVTHDQTEAMTMANRIVVMNEGIVQQVGPPLELYDRPANLFVASFIGSPTMNVLPATVNAKNPKHALLADGTSIAFNARNAKPGQAVSLGIRPEHLMIGKGNLKGTVRVIEPLGMCTQVTVLCQDTNLTLMVMDRVNLTPGDDVALSVEPQHVHLFDAATGTRID